jgi:hypothetical protein
MLATAQLEPAPMPAAHVADDSQCDVHGILAAATARARRDSLPYAGTVTPEEAWLLATAGAAILIDVRTAEEYKYVGHVPGTPLVQWQSGAALSRNPRFTRELAGKAATRAGFTRVFNVLEGFEGEITADGQRGTSGGWRYHGLPWVQD